METNENVKEPSVHEGHRQRVRERFLSEGIDNFAPHEVLELMLMQIIKRGDVNPIGHRLHDRFGSVAGVLEASIEELCEVEGVGEQTAFFLHMMPQIFRRYSLDKEVKCERYDKVAKLYPYVRSLYVGLTHERVHLLLFDNSMRLIDTCVITEGSVNCAAITVRKIVELALIKKAAAVVISHNHPNGLALPSGNDIEVTRNIESALSTVSIPLVEHIVVAEYGANCIMKGERGYLRAAIGGMAQNEAFYKEFYGE